MQSYNNKYYYTNVMKKLLHFYTFLTIDKQIYKKRIVVEHTNQKIQSYRRLNTIYEKHIKNYNQFTYLALCDIITKYNNKTDKTERNIKTAKTKQNIETAKTKQNIKTAKTKQNIKIKPNGILK